MSALQLNVAATTTAPTNLATKVTQQTSDEQQSFHHHRARQAWSKKRNRLEARRPTPPSLRDITHNRFANALRCFRGSDSLALRLSGFDEL